MTLLETNDAVCKPVLFGYINSLKRLSTPTATGHKLRILPKKSPAPLRSDSEIASITGTTKGHQVQASVNKDGLHKWFEQAKSSAKPTVLVSGGGPSGYSAALALRKSGFQVLVAEKRSH